VAAGKDFPAAAPGEIKSDLTGRSYLISSSGKRFEDRAMHAEMLVLQFTREVVDQPIIYRLVKDFALEFNLLKAAINPRQEGVIVMELRGHPKDFRRGLKYLREAGVKVRQVAREVRRNEERCYQCGTCTAVCPTGALHIERPEMGVAFDATRCSACELCCPACPAHAMEVRLNREAV
jgi:heterodisulfide reductase subunit A-like polyferredoxin